MSDQNVLAWPRVDSAYLAGQFRRWRILNRIKQEHAAELFGVSQSTVSRWEAGQQSISAREGEKMATLFAAGLSGAAEAALARLVEESARPIHLICDLTHRLLACSSPRAAEFGLLCEHLKGRSMWRYATPEIAQTERQLSASGWHELPAPSPIEFDPGMNHSKAVPIRKGRCRWTRFSLADGNGLRLVETLEG